MRLLLLLLALALACGCSDDKTSPVTPDTTPPQVTSTSPADGDSSVSLSAVIRANFSEEIDRWTLTSSSFTILPAISGSVAYGNRTAVFTPSAQLDLGTTYTATITDTVTDLAGNHLNSDVNWSFTTTFGDIMPLAVGNRWVYRVVTYENPVYPLDTTYDTILIVRDTAIQGETWYIDGDGALYANRSSGLWRLSSGGQLYLFAKFPGTAGQVYNADPDISQTVNIQGTSVLISTPINFYFCYYYLTTSSDLTLRRDYYYAPRLGLVRFDRFLVEPPATLKEQWLLIGISLN